MRAARGTYMVTERRIDDNGAPRLDVDGKQQTEHVNLLDHMLYEHGWVEPSEWEGVYEPDMPDYKLAAVHRGIIHNQYHDHPGGRPA